MTLDTLCDPDMRIWSITNEPVAFPYYYVAVAGAILAAILLGVSFLIKKRSWTQI